MALVAGVSPSGGVADVYVDGRRIGSVSTRASATGAARDLANVTLPYGRHVVRIVVRSGTVRLDALAFTR